MYLSGLYRKQGDIRAWDSFLEKSANSVLYFCVCVCVCPLCLIVFVCLAARLLSVMLSAAP